MSATAGTESVAWGTLALAVEPDQVRLRDTGERALPFALAAALGAALAVASAVWWPAVGAAGAGIAGAALFGLGAWCLVSGRVGYAFDRQGLSVRRGPRRLGRLAGVYLQTGTGPGGDSFTLFLRLEGRPARKVRTDDPRDPVQFIGMRLAAVLGVPFHDGPGRPR